DNLTKYAPNMGIFELPQQTQCFVSILNSIWRTNSVSGEDFLQFSKFCNAVYTNVTIVLYKGSKFVAWHKSLFHIDDYVSNYCKNFDKSGFKEFTGTVVEVSEDGLFCEMI